MLEQVIIAVTGIPAIWLANDYREWRRQYACLFGLAGQPFWILAAYEASQWGIFILTILYTVAWMRGFKRYWGWKIVNLFKTEAFKGK